MVNGAKLKPDPRNARRHDERNKNLVRASLQEVGPFRSIAVDGNDIIRAGNATYEQALGLGLKVRVVDAAPNELIAVRRVDLKGRKAERAALLDNRAGELAAWDETMIAELAANDAKMLEGLFIDDELAALLADVTPTINEDEGAAGALLDRAAELQEKWQVKRGDIFEVGRHRVMCGDSTSKEDVGRLMQKSLASLVVIDPPYGVEYADKNAFLNAIAKGNRIQKRIEGDHQSKDKTQELWRNAFCQMSNIMCAGAVVYCFMPQGGDQMMMMMMMMGAGIEPRHELIWLKNNHVLGRVDYAYKHEPILYAWKAGGHKFYGDFQTSIIECPKPQKSDLHPTMKPVALIELLIRNSSKQGEIVYDGFVGSGTTIIACESSGRVCRAIEKDAPYIAVTLQRLTALGLEARRVEDGGTRKARKGANGTKKITAR